MENKHKALQDQLEVMKRGIIETFSKTSDNDIDMLRHKMKTQILKYLLVFIYIKMQTKEINDIKIKPVVHLALESHEIVGYDYFPTLYSNIYICSKRKSGKTTLI